MKPVSQAKFWIAGLLVAFSALYLVVSSLRGAGMSEVPISEVRGQSVAGRVKMSGRVLADSTTYDATHMRLQFIMTDDSGSSIGIVFQGIKPNAFRDGGQVMIEGYYDAKRGVVNAETLMAKCPSKYDHPATEQAPAQMLPLKGS